MFGSLCTSLGKSLPTLVVYWSKSHRNYWCMTANVAVREWCRTFVGHNLIIMDVSWQKSLSSLTDVWQRKHILRAVLGFTPVSNNTKTSYLIMYWSPLLLYSDPLASTRGIWRCPMVSGKNTLTADPLGPVSCGEGLTWILFVFVNPLMDWDLWSLEALPVPWALCHVP